MQQMFTCQTAIIVLYEHYKMYADCSPSRCNEITPLENLY